MPIWLMSAMKWGGLGISVLAFVTLLYIRLLLALTHLETAFNSGNPVLGTPQLATSRVQATGAPFPAGTQKEEVERRRRQSISGARMKESYNNLTYIVPSKNDTASSVISR